MADLCHASRPRLPLCLDILQDSQPQPRYLALRARSWRGGIDRPRWGRRRQPSRLVDPHRGPQGDLLLRGTANRPLRCFQSPRAPQNEGFRAAVAESPGDRQSKQVGRRIGQFDTRRRSHRSRLRPYFRTTRLGHRRTSGFPPRSGRARGMVSCHHPRHMRDVGSIHRPLHRIATLDARYSPHTSIAARTHSSCHGFHIRNGGGGRIRTCG